MRSVKDTACVERMDSRMLGVRSCVWTSSYNVGGLGLLQLGKEKTQGRGCDKNGNKNEV